SNAGNTVQTTKWMARKAPKAVPGRRSIQRIKPAVRAEAGTGAVVARFSGISLIARKIWPYKSAAGPSLRLACANSELAGCHGLVNTGSIRQVQGKVRRSHGAH